MRAVGSHAADVTQDHAAADERWRRVAVAARFQPLEVIASFTVQFAGQDFGVNLQRGSEVASAELRVGDSLQASGQFLQL